MDFGQGEHREAYCFQERGQRYAMPRHVRSGSPLKRGHLQKLVNKHVYPEAWFSFMPSCELIKSCINKDYIHVISLRASGNIC